MLSIDIPKPIIVIVGPTAVGKSEFAILLAEKIKGEIVSADSRLFYKGMDIGTAKPNRSQLAMIPHHLIDVVNPDETLSLVEFQVRAKSAINTIHDQGKSAILVGGTGQYIHAVLEEWSVPPQRPDFRLREVLEAWGDEIGKSELHDKLKVLDPVAADFIDSRNARRTIRALEVILLTGQRFSTQRNKGTSLYNTITIGLFRPREELYKIIDDRVEAMMAHGFLTEVKNLLKRGYSPELPALSAIGYKQLIQYLQGKISLEEAIQEIKRMTRIFVRRQSNWFRKDDPNIHWLDVNENILLTAIKLIQDKSNWCINVR